MAEWQTIETAPLNESVLIFIPSPVAEHYGAGIYRALQKQRISGLRLWMTTGLHHGSDIVDRDYQPTHWMPLPEPPATLTTNEQWVRNISPDPPETK